MRETQIQSLGQKIRIILSDLLPKNTVLFCRPEDAKKLIKSIRCMENHGVVKK